MSGKPNGKFMPRFVLPLVLAGGSLAIMLVMLAGPRNVAYAISVRPLSAAEGNQAVPGLLPPPEPAWSPAASPPVVPLAQGDGGPSVITVCASCPYTAVQAAVSGNLWQTNAPATVGPLAAGAGTDVEVTVTIVDTTQSGDFDAATVTATSQEDPSVSDSSMLITMVSAACEPVSGATFDYSPAMPQVGQTVTFIGTVVITSTAPVNYTWNFGDESGEVTGQFVTHAYDDEGSYTVVMTASNACGEDTAPARTVTVGLADYYIYLPLVLRNYE